MTVSSAPGRNDYTGSGTLIYPYTFRIFADSELSVYVDHVLQTLTTNYTVSGAGATGGGNVTFVASVNGKAVAIVRNVAATQAVDLVENDPFSAETVEAALDRPIMVAQQLQEITGRALAVAISSTQKNIVVDDLVAGKFLQVKTPASAGLQMVDIVASGSIGIPVSIAQGGTGQTAGPSIVGKSGNGAGAYSTASASFVDVDGTNLSYTVTVPVGWKLIVEAFGVCGQATAVPGIFIGIFDSIAATVTGTLQLLPSNTTETLPFATKRVITGDGVSHTVSLRFATANIADSALIQNSAANNALPQMFFELKPSS